VSDEADQRQFELDAARLIGREIVGVQYWDIQRLGTRSDPGALANRSLITGPRPSGRPSRAPESSNGDGSNGWAGDRLRGWMATWLVSSRSMAMGRLAV
jgi:hypothetical protein